ncbi:SMC family ATPase [Streptomyces sp. NPDC005805]|uniref:SMC family ATPase n=1 Tax=Streptomyces sp. NPDC005805 TaxID=3157068 RepID=UPI0033D68F1F
MRLHRMTVTAFGPFGTAQHIDFDALSEAGLFLLHGPTGAGKTSVLDAVCYALYGSVPGARQNPGTTLRSDHAGDRTPTEVVLDLTLGGRRLEITRRPAQPRPKARGTGFTTERAVSGLREYDPRTGEWSALSRSHQEIGEEITRLIGMSREQFCQVVLLPQGDFARFLRADAESRGRLLGRLFDTRRFAAVEERLAEQRRAAEAEVRAGDERLLALAHRMEQAAGSAAGARPLPDRGPGDPGLAAAVLDWAAIARTDAREERDIAALRARAAEERQAGARAALDAARETARLQRRHAETLHRSAALAEGRAAHEALLAREDRARRADRVLPALRLRDEAERADRAARAARDRSRAALPEELTAADAERLTARERALRQELGGLDAARREEARGAELAQERAGLDRRSRADEDALHEASAWLAGWEALRRSLTDRIAAAQEAATRAEYLAGRLGTARDRLAAACERDELAARAARAETRLRALHERANTARSHWLDLKERRLLGIAAELAAALTPGAPCTVCGSPDHPSPARPTSDHIDRAAEDEAYEASVRAEASRAEAERDLAVLHESHTTSATRARAAGTAAEAVAAGPGLAQAPAGAASSAGPGPDAGPAGPGAAPRGDAVVPAPRGHDGDPTADELRSLVDTLTREHTEARRAAGDMQDARAALERGERERSERVQAQRAAGERIAARNDRREALDRELARIEGEVARARGESESVAARARLLERRVALLAEAADAVRAAGESARRLTEAEEALAEAAASAGFAGPDDAAAAALAPDARRDARARIDAWLAESAAVAERLAEEDARAAADEPPVDLTGAEAASTAADRALRETASRLDAARERCAALDRLTREAVAEVRRLGPVRERYDRVARLAGLTAGTSADNERKMRLESYVLAARLEQVAAAATVRLRRMSSGRYTLVHSDARAGGRRAGLGLHVVDAWTGRERDTATLSGGETFFVSLALALGLADVVTDEAGGMRLDTLFIDEGFGSLDEQTLDEVLDVLDSLRERDRSVGIVSHVGDLRRRIPVQLEVAKSRSGSAVRLLTAGAAGALSG